MSLFQKSVEKKYLSELNEAVINSKYTSFQEYFGNSERQENIRNSKEEQFQEGFLRELFVNIFGYTLNPEPGYNLTTELKNVSDSRKVDGAVLNGDGDAVAVIELKSTTTTDLDSIETQAFGYKNHQPKCVYVITSNFEKLRFYIEDAIDYIDFYLFDLSRDQFALMWLCLSKDNLLNNRPLDIKKSSIIREEDITKKLYTDYSAFRKAVFNNLVKNNLDKDKLLLFKKTQKLLDRFLFIFFAEDRLLLPPNSINRIIERWESLKDMDEYRPLYFQFIKYFGYMNKGYNGKDYDIFAYNGGLFKPDEVLDNILIDDDILLEHTQKLSTYNFDTDVDVNILGHIFEHSLVEIESIHAEINGEVVDSNKSKRKKDGIFYTPKYITQYIVENTIGRLCKEKRVELGIVDEEYVGGKRGRKKTTIIALDGKLSTYKDWLLGLTILDPACGSGAFLNMALDFLIREHQKINVLDSQLHEENLGLHDIETDILERNIYGVDINEESVEIAKLSLWLRTAQKGRKLNTLNNNIKCGNSLIDDPEVAGDKAFNWQEEFPDVFAGGGFDVVIGNPPYVRQELLGKENKLNLTNSFPSVGNGTADLYIYFYELGVSLLKDAGYLSYITPNKWFKTKYGQGLRTYIKNYKIIEIIDFFELKIFHDASTEPQIITIYNKPSNDDFEYIPIELTNDFLIQKYKKILIEKNGLKQEEWIFVDGFEKKLLNKIFTQSITLENYTQKGIKRGILTGKNRAFIIDKNIKKQIVIDDPSSEALIEPYANATDIKAWNLEHKGEYYFINTGYDIEVSENSYRGIWNHLNKYYEELDKRQDKGKTLYNLRACDYYESFHGPKIIFIHTAVKHYFYYDTEETFVNNNSYIIVNSDRLLSAILNSKIFSFLKIHLFPAFGDARNRGRSRLNYEKMARIPIPTYIEKNLKNSIEERVVKQHNISPLFKTKIYNFLDYIQYQFPIEILSRKLQNWNILEFSDFIKELNKAIKTSGGKKLSKFDEMEWMELFKTKKEEAQAFKAQIDKTDREIDQMVYELYGLSEDEIAIVEGR